MVTMQSVGKTVEVYRTRSAEAAKKKLNRRKKRTREKARTLMAALEQAKKDGASKAVIEQAKEKAAAAVATSQSVIAVPTDEFELVTVRGYFYYYCCSNTPYLHACLPSIMHNCFRSFGVHTRLVQQRL